VNAPPEYPPVVGEQRDPGLQPERTALAWRRTLLAFTVVCLVAIQTLPDVEGSAALLYAAVVALVATPPLWWFVSRHHRHTHRHLDHATPRLRHGRRIVVMCAGTSLLGLSGLVLILLF
jgi:putative membrane protein